MKQLIAIPQKCYGILTPDSPENICGLYTEGLIQCCPIYGIANTPNGNYLIFYHADATTNLTPGISEWLNNLPHNTIKIAIHYQHREGDPYRKNIETALSGNKHSVNIIQEAWGSPNFTVYKNGSTRTTAQTNLSNLLLGYDHDDTPIELVTSDFHYRTGAIINKNQYDPVCVFDGTNLLKEENFSENIKAAIKLAENSQSSSSEQPRPIAPDQTNSSSSGSLNASATSSSSTDSSSSSTKEIIEDHRDNERTRFANYNTNRSSPSPIPPLVQPQQELGPEDKKADSKKNGPGCCNIS